MKMQQDWSISVRWAMALCLGVMGTTGALAADPPGYSSVTKWTLNDNYATVYTYVQDFTAGFDGEITLNQELTPDAVDAIRTASDTPPDPEAGAAIQFIGDQHEGNLASSSVIVPESGGTGGFFVPTGTTWTGNSGNYSYYDGSRTISAWIKLKSDAVAEGGSRVIFYHGHPVVNINSRDRVCQLDDANQTSEPGSVVQPCACRGFAMGLYRPTGSSYTYLFFGNTNGDFDNHNAAFLLTSTSNPSECSLSDVQGLTSDTWHHVVGIFSLDLMGFGANSVILYIDGKKCDSGKIAHPYTDVGTSTDPSTWRIAAGVDIPSTTSSQQFSVNPFKGKLDDVRVYDRALGQPAVTWLYNNTGRSSN